MCLRALEGKLFIWTGGSEVHAQLDISESALSSALGVPGWGRAVVGAEHESPDRSCRLARPGEHLHFASFKLRLGEFDASLSSEP